MAKSAKNTPTMVHLLGQQAMVVIALPIILRSWLAAFCPMHRWVVSVAGVEAAMFAVVFATFLAGYLFAVVLTIPALTGVRFRKIQVKKWATIEDVMQAMPIVGLNFVGSFVGLSISLLVVTPQHLLADLSLNVPTSNTQVGLEAFICWLISEVWFFAVHKYMHENKTLYAKVHKMHHQWTAPVAITATYSHPLEHAVINGGVSMIGPAVCSLLFHGWTESPALAIAYALFGMLHGSGVHCGYFAEDDGFHDLHHEHFSCNYGLSGIMDALNGSHRSYEEDAPIEANVAVESLNDLQPLAGAPVLAAVSKAGEAAKCLCSLSGVGPGDFSVGITRTQNFDRDAHRRRTWSAAGVETCRRDGRPLTTNIKLETATCGEPGHLLRSSLPTRCSAGSINMARDVRRKTLRSRAPSK